MSPTIKREQIDAEHTMVTIEFEDQAELDAWVCKDCDGVAGFHAWDCAGREERLRKLAADARALAEGTRKEAP